MKMPKTKSQTTNKIAQQIYLKHAGVASQIYAKYADSGTVPTNLISGGGIKPLANQQQQQAQQPTQPEPPKAPETPQQPTQPAAPAIEPIPANVAPPPVVPPPSAGTPPATNMATGKPITPGQPQPGTMTNDGQLSGVPANSPSLQPEPAPAAPMRMQTHIENPANPGVSAQTHIAPAPDVHADAHAGITTPEAVNPTGQAAGQTGGQSAGQTAGQTAPNTGNQAQNAGQTGGQTSGQPTGQPKPVDPAQFAQDLQKMPREQAVPKAKEYVQAELAKPENQQVMSGLEDLKSGDPARANSPAAQAYKAAMQKAPEGMIREEYARLMQANPTASPQEQGNFMRQAIDNGMARFNEMPFPAQLMMGLGLGAGLIGVFSSLFGEGGAESGLMGLLGIGAAGLIGANYGMFGNDARKMVGQGAVGLGRMMGMNIPGAEDFTPEAIEKKKREGMAAVQAAIIGDKKKKIQGGGWKGGLAKIEELRSPLDQLASTADNYGKDTAITMLMGAMGTDDPAAAQQKFDELMQQRQQMMDPQYLRNQILGDQSANAEGASARRWMLSGLEAAYGKYPGAAPAAAAPQQ